MYLQFQHLLLLKRDTSKERAKDRELNRIAQGSRERAQESREAGRRLVYNNKMLCFVKQIKRFQFLKSSADHCRDHGIFKRHMARVHKRVIGLSPFMYDTLSIVYQLLDIQRTKNYYQTRHGVRQCQAQGLVFCP